MSPLIESKKLDPRLAQLVRDHLNAMLSSTEFQACGRTCKLLRHLVETAVTDPGSPLKEQLIGMEVFGYPPDWNPQSDPIVRVNIGRLRARLDHYYRVPGRDEVVRIEIPKGRYTPKIRVDPTAALGISSSDSEQQLVDDSIAAPPCEPQLTSPPLNALPSRRRLLLSLASAGAGAGAATCFAAVWGTKPSSLTHHASLQRLTHERGDLTNAAFTADGQNVVFSARWAGESPRIYTLKIGQSFSRPLGLPAANLCDVSPAGDLLFTLGDGHSGVLARAESGDGPYQEIGEHVVDAVWMPDGRTIAAARLQAGGLGLELPFGKRIHTIGGHPNRVSLSAHADGRIAFADNSRGPVDFCVADTSGNVRRVSSGWRLVGGIRWVPPRNRLVISGARRGCPALHIVDLDANGAQETFYSTPQIWNLYDCLPSGRILASCVDSRLHIAGGARDREREQYFTAVTNCRLVGLTPDGSRAVLMDLLGTGHEGNSPILLASSPSRPPIRIAEGYAPQIAPDGTAVVCMERSANGDSLVVAPIPSGLPRRYTLPKTLRCEGAEFAGSADRFLLQVAEGTERRTLLYRLQTQQVSAIKGVPYLTLVTPDGKWGLSPAGSELRMANVETGELRKVRRLNPGWAALRWSASGDALFVYEPMGFSAGRISRVNLGTGAIETCFELRPEDEVGVYMQPWVDVTPDGRHYAYTFQRDLSELYVLDGIL